MKTRILTFLIIVLCSVAAVAQTGNNVKPEDRNVDMDVPTFVPMVKVGKVMQDGDSIQYVELNPLYVLSLIHI